MIKKIKVSQQKTKTSFVEVDKETCLKVHKNSKLFDEAQLKNMEEQINQEGFTCILPDYMLPKEAKRKK